MSTKNNNIESQKQSNYQNLIDKDMQAIHNKELGFSVPEDYFAKSKDDILSKISDKKGNEKYTPFYKKPIIWYAAASIILLIAITLIKSNRDFQIDNNQTIVLDTIKNLDKDKFVDSHIEETAEDDVLITSLFIEDNEIDEFIDNYVFDEALIDEAL